MDFRIFSDKPTSVSLEFNLGTNTYRLFRNFVKQTAADHPDTSVKVLFATIDKQIDSPQQVTSSADPAAPSQPQQMAINIGQANIAASIGNLSQKLDMVIKSIAAVQSKSDGFPKEIKFDTEVLDGFAHRIDTMVKSVLQDKMLAFSGAQDLLVKTDAILEKLNEVKKTIASVDVGKVTAAYAAQLPTTNVIASQTQVAPTIPPTATPAPVAPQTTAVAVEKPSAKVVAGNTMLYYPATSKEVQPKCFGHFLAKDTSPDTPCLSCVQVNNCKDKTQARIVELNKQGNQEKKPDCFGKHLHDLDCSVCKFTGECQIKSM